MTKKPLVSIITPCYNSEKYISRLLESIINQSYENIELIAIDDGSNDDTKKIIFEYKKRLDEKKIILKYIFQENGGQAEAINKGLAICEGDYLTWPDSDDFLHKDSIYERVSFLEDYTDYGIVRCNGFYVREYKDTLKNIERISTKKNRFKEYIFDDLLFKKTFIIPVSYMVRTKYLFQIYPNRKIYVSRSGQNYQMLLPITSKYKCGFIDKDLVYILVRDDSHSRYKRPYEKLLYRIDDVEKIITETINHCECNLHEYLPRIEAFHNKQRLKLASKYNKKRDLENYFNLLLAEKRIELIDIYYFVKGKIKLFNQPIEKLKA